MQHPGVALKDKVKVALDETRLLILGSQILFGFQFNGVFQDNFEAVSAHARVLAIIAFVLMSLTIGCLIAPSMQHRLVERGNDSVRLHRVTSLFAHIALLPFAVSLGVDVFVVLEGHAGTLAAALLAATFLALALFFWFGIERYLGKPETPVNNSIRQQTPLHARIEQMLTEARLLLPGAQALFGFQLAVMLTKAFEQLPQSSKVTHVCALCLIALTVILLMTPAAIHRISFGGDDTEQFHRIGSRFVAAAAAPLGIGIGADIYVAVARAIGSMATGAACAIAVISVLIALWYVQPLLLRRHT
jgi:Family of unknown function (DUF6328)